MESDSKVRSSLLLKLGVAQAVMQLLERLTQEDHKLESSWEIYRDHVSKYNKKRVGAITSNSCL
jgi:hypothetical protein